MDAQQGQKEIGIQQQRRPVVNLVTPVAHAIDSQIRNRTQSKGEW